MGNINNKFDNGADIFQGLLVAVFYCFLNTEVWFLCYGMLCLQAVVRVCYLRTCAILVVLSALACYAGCWTSKKSCGSSLILLHLTCCIAHFRQFFYLQVLVRLLVNEAFYCTLQQYLSQHLTGLFWYILNSNARLRVFNWQKLLVFHAFWTLGTLLMYSIIMTLVYSY